MFAIVRELEQQFECGRVEFELEQHADELEQQCGFSGRLQLHLKSRTGNSGATGMGRPALREINQPGLFGRAFRKSGGLIKMKRYGNMFDSTFNRENLNPAYMDARRGKRKKRACFEFEKNLGNNLNDLHKEIHSGEYRPMPYFKFTVYEPKERVIYAPAFRDIVVQHAIYRIIYPVFDKTFINSSFACRKGFGTHKASDYTQQALRGCAGDAYTLKLDIRKFFYSIDRAVLRKLIEQKIKDQRLVDMMMVFAHIDEPKGIPIGNLLSQIYALIYLNPLDHFIKRNLMVKKYVRYVDDFILIGITRDQCLEYKRKIVQFLADELGLVLSKSTIAKVKSGLNFVGYRTWRSRRVIRKFSLYKFKRKVKERHWQAVVSLLGHAKNTNSIPCMMGILREAVHAKNFKLPKNYRQIYNAYAG